MTIHHCDICQKQIKEVATHVRIDKPFSQAELCPACAAPVIKLLKKHELYDMFGLQSKKKAL